MAQVLVAIARPAGSAGLTVHPVMAPPEAVGVCVAMAEPLVATRVLGLKAIEGATSLTVRVKEAEACPPELEAVMV
jgi:hypothetical protein